MAPPSQCGARPGSAGWWPPVLLWATLSTSATILQVKSGQGQVKVHFNEFCCQVPLMLSKHFLALTTSTRPLSRESGSEAASFTPLSPWLCSTKTRRTPSGCSSGSSSWGWSCSSSLWSPLWALTGKSEKNTYIIITRKLKTVFISLAWGLIPNFPAKEEEGVEPADIIIR